MTLKQILKSPFVAFHNAFYKFDLLPNERNPKLECIVIDIKHLIRYL